MTNKDDHTNFNPFWWIVLLCVSAALWLVTHPRALAAIVKFLETL